MYKKVNKIKRKRGGERQTKIEKKDGVKEKRQTKMEERRKKRK